MTPHVIDTNVLAVANGRHPDASDGCVANCVAFLLDVKQDGLVVLDDERRILDEYRRNVKPGGQPRTGYQFFKWLRDCHVRQVVVKLTPRSTLGGAEDFEEFPDAPDLAGFDPADRKFVAVARASDRDPEIANATDADWVDYRQALALHGVRVRQLCVEPNRGCDRNPFVLEV